jgi:hypothetical protein
MRHEARGMFNSSGKTVLQLSLLIAFITLYSILYNYELSHAWDTFENVNKNMIIVLEVCYVQVKSITQKEGNSTNFVRGIILKY